AVPSRRGALPTDTDASSVPAVGQPPQATPAPAGPRTPPTRPTDISTSGRGTGVSAPTPSTTPNTAQTTRTEGEQAREEACDQRTAIQAQMAATNRERYEARRKMNQELVAYRQELARQHVPAAEAAKRYNEKQEVLKESYGVNGLDQRTRQLGDQ